ncbi:MAG: hypothetical protein RLY86_1224 [Pseudomonadota bacterium]|jgi:methyl-accepting chemotaxis protein
MTQLTHIRRLTSLLILGLLAMQVPAIAVGEWLLAPAFSGTAALVTLGIAAAAGAAWWLLRGTALERLALAALLPLAAGAALLAFRDHPWHGDLHIYFFVLLAVVAGYCDRAAILTASGSVILHHLLTTLLAPGYLMPGGMDLLRLGLHLWLVLFETGLLLWLATTLSRAFNASHAALEEAQKAHQETEAANRAREETAARARTEQIAALSRVADRLEAEVGQLARDVAAAAGAAAKDAESLRGFAARGIDIAVGVSRSSEGASMNVETLAAGTGQLAASISEIGEQLERSAAVSHRAAARARETRAIVSSLVETTRSIDSVLDAISELAAQTQLLALNATIEASRAGEAGKGFNVVANEVKNLAGQSARSAQEVGDKITAIRRSTDDAVGAIEEIAAVILDLDQINATIAGAVTEQDAATRDMASHAAAAAEASRASADLSGEVVVVGRSTGEAADRMTRLSETLKEQTDSLTRAVGTFAAEVRRAG